MSDGSKISEWLKSGDVQKELKIDSCELMHLRVDGELSFKKEGNAYLYERKDVDRVKKLRSKENSK
jgi:hypothetical protein